MDNSTIIQQAVKATFPEDMIPKLGEFHTYAEWKRIGFQVMKGQKAALVAYLWKYRETKGGKATKDSGSKEQPQDGEEKDGSPDFIKVKSYLFSQLQVERKAATV